jgi:predicted aspartyl protease
MKYLLLFVLLPVFAFAQQTPAEKQAYANRDKYLFSTKPVQKKFVKTIPFDSGPKKYILVPVTIEGKTYNFMFDTGASTIVSKEIAAELKLPVLFEGSLTDAAGIEKRNAFYKVQGMSIAGIDFKDVAVATGDMKKFEDAMCQKIDGLLGVNVMRNCYWKVDYINGQLTFSDREIKPSEGMYPIDFTEHFGGTPILNMYMGRYQVTMLMDTGFSGELTIRDSIYFNARKGHERPYRKGYGTNAITAFDTEHKEKYMGLLDTVYMFNRHHVILDPVVDIDNAEVFLVGNEVFKSFGEVVFNWKEHRIYLPEKVIDRKDRYPSFGFSPLWVNNKLVVSVVWEGTEAYKKGLTAGSVITAVNGQDTTNISPAGWCGLIGLFGDNKPPEINISVQGKDGKITNHTLKKVELLK